MPFDHVPLFLEVVEHEEYVDIDAEYDASGKLIRTTPIESTRTAFVHLRAPDGTTVRAAIPSERLDDFLAMMFPDDFKPESA